MSPDEVSNFQFYYTKCLLERGVLERLADNERIQSDKENVCVADDSQLIDATVSCESDLEHDTISEEEELLNDDDAGTIGETVSSNVEPQQCAECSRRFLDATAFREHIAECRVLNPKKCSECSLPFATISQRNRHQREAHGATTQWSCPDCSGPPEYFISEKSRDIHIYNVHSKTLTDVDRTVIENKYQCICSQCGFKTWSKKTLQVHRTKEHISKDWSLWCPACAFGAENNVQLAQHVESMHTNDPCWYICLICYRAISRVGGDQSAELHQALHAEGAGFPCAQCCKMFETEEKLTVHSGIHVLDINSYHCGVCDTPNRTYRRLARHMSLNHSPLRSALESASTSRPGLHKSMSGTYVCNQCAQTYDCESQLLAHQVCLHQGFKVEQYPCPYCLKIFARQHYLALHLRRHLDEKPHKCSFCPRSFAHFSSLKSHEIMKHTRDFRFNCPQCDKGFVSRVKVLKHLTQTHHMPIDQAVEAVPAEVRTPTIEQLTLLEENEDQQQEQSTETESAIGTTIEEATLESEFKDNQVTDDEAGVEDPSAPFVTGGSVFYQLTHPDGSQSVVRLEPGQQLLLEDEQGVKQVIDFNDILPQTEDQMTS